MKGKRNTKQTFNEIYINNCTRYGICPQKYLSNSTDDGIITIKVDRLKNEDWKPLIETLKQVDDIKYLSTRNNSQNKIEIPTKFYDVIKRILKSTTFECLILEKINLNEENIQILSEGFKENSNLRYLSFEKCRIGNKKLEILIPSIKNSVSLRAINLSDCNLTWKISDLITNLIQQQNVIKRGKIWQNTLRYRMCHMEEMGGLMSINLNNNPGLSDRGLRILINGLNENICLKELFLRQCGLTDEIIIDLMGINEIRVDIDDNSFQDEEIYDKIYGKYSKPNLVKFQRKFKPQIIGKMDQLPFKTGLVNEKMKLDEKRIKIEMNKLKDELTICKSELEKEKFEHSQTKLNLMKIQNEMKNDKKLLEDSVLNAIESTFNKFQHFINLFKTSELQNFIQIPTKINLKNPQNDDQRWIPLTKRSIE